MRKIIIGLITIGFVALLFWVYARVMDTKPIEVRNVEGSNDLEMPESGSGSQRVEDWAKYVVLDPETKETSRIFGFKRLLNPDEDTSRLQVEKPYMIFYESDYQCRIDADMGVFQMEAPGSYSAPKDARLNGNVKIHVTPKPNSRMNEIIVEMDDLVFSSERSEFSTDRRIHVKSGQGELKGTGLVVIFDPADGKVDFCRIIDLQEIRIWGLENQKPQAKFKTKTAKAETDTVSADPVSVRQTDDSVAASGTIEEIKTESLTAPRYYRCIFEDNVEITYGNEIVVTAADQVDVQNILFSKLDQGVEVDQVPKQKKERPEQISKPVQLVNKESEPSAVELEPEIHITCDGGIVLEPMKNEDAGQMSAAESVLYEETALMPLRVAEIHVDTHRSSTLRKVNFAGEENRSDGSETISETAEETPLDVADSTVKTASDLSDSPPAKFEARKIDYDLRTGSSLAHGPVRFTFYQDPDPNSTAAKSRIPITVTADKNARFIADPSQKIKQVVFSGNVMTTRTSKTPDFVQIDNLHSEKLTVDLDEVKDGSVDLNNIQITEGRVYVESYRTQEDRELSRVKLYCTKMSYNKVGEVLLADGPGKIEMVNTEHVQTEGSDPNNPTNRPCYAMVDAFTTIRWDIGKQSVIVDGDQDQMRLAYIPLVDSKPDKFMYVDAIRFDLSFTADSTGKTMIKKIHTDKPIVFEEWNGDKSERLHYITGQMLDYDTVDGDGWIKISGTPAVPCNVDNFLTPEVRVHPVTGDIDTTISTTPGILKGGD